MSLLLQRKGPAAPLPRLEGKEVLVGPNPDAAKVKGVMFGGRKQFLVENLGEQGFSEFVAKLSPRTANYTKIPLASSWCEFASLIELDRAIYEALKAKHPNVLALIGAASAELGIGKVYKSLDSEELEKFLESQALFHSQFQKFGHVQFQKTTNDQRPTNNDQRRTTKMKRPFFQQFYLNCLAHASYLIADGGEAAVVDPQRDVEQYIEAASWLGARIRYVIETHLHADFVSGHRELAARTGATIVFSEKAGVEFPHKAVRDG